MSMLLLIIGLLLFVGLVVFHEFGHFIAARRNGVEVEEFGIGFPPRAKVLKRKNGTVYTLNWLPLGGFVKLKGENDSDTEPGSYGAASLKTKVKIMLAGVGMNLLAAFVLLTLAAAVGIPQLIDNQFTVARDTKIAKQEVYVGDIEKDSPAEKSGLRVRDKILDVAYVDGGCATCPISSQEVTSANQLPQITQAYAGQEVMLGVERDGNPQIIHLRLRSLDEVEASKKTDHPKGYMGVRPTEYIVQRSTWSSPIVAAGLIKQFTVETFKGIGSALLGLSRGDTTKASEQVSGPVGVFVLIKDGSVLGPEFILFIIAVISLTLAIMNALPIPALDGGRLFVTMLYRVRNKPLSKETEDKIHGFGFLALMILFVLITIVDVKRFF